MVGTLEYAKCLFFTSSYLANRDRVNSMMASSFSSVIVPMSASIVSRVSSSLD